MLGKIDNQISPIRYKKLIITCMIFNEILKKLGSSKKSRTKKYEVDIIKIKKYV